MYFIFIHIPFFELFYIFSLTAPGFFKNLSSFKKICPGLVGKRGVKIAYFHTLFSLPALGFCIFYFRKFIKKKREFRVYILLTAPGIWIFMGGIKTAFFQNCDIWSIRELGGCRFYKKSPCLVGKWGVLQKWGVFLKYIKKLCFFPILGRGPSSQPRAFDFFSLLIF